MSKASDAALILERARSLPLLDSLGPDVLVDTHTAAAYLGIAAKSLRNLARSPRSPVPSVRIGCAVRYRAGDILAAVRMR